MYLIVIYYIDSPLRWLAEGYPFFVARQRNVGFLPFPGSSREGERSFLPADFADANGHTWEDELWDWVGSAEGLNLQSLDSHLTTQHSTLC
ncbi:hypothetical protein VTL71DRAFT_16325 [Oculimacula yallundae]|uniref:Uncharacterized protein n=1 Tax=Oculimacula yallundae TaxID=86028 RepID=A0ABR4CE48_9HELO